VFLFQGDSITDCGRTATPPSRCGGALAPASAARRRGGAGRHRPGFQVLQSRHQWEQGAGFAAALDRGAIDLKPDVLSILIGVTISGKARPRVQRHGAGLRATVRRAAADDARRPAHVHLIVSSRSCCARARRCAVFPEFDPASRGGGAYRGARARDVRSLADDLQSANPDGAP